MQEIRDADAFRRGVLDATEPTVVLFWATWCPFCRRFKPEFETMSAGLKAQSALVYLDDYSNPLWEDYDVEVVPTIALFQDGQLIERQDGILGYGLDQAAVRAFVARASPRLS